MAKGWRARTGGSIAALAMLVASVTASAEDGARVIALEILGDDVRGAEITPARPAPVLRVRQGDELVLVWTSDTPIVVHLHGYDIETSVTPGEGAEMAFTARAAGRFPIASHGDGRGHHHETILYLEVHPR